MRVAPWKKRYCSEKVGGEEGVRLLRELYDSGIPIRDIMERFGLKSPDCIYALIGGRRRGKYRGRGRITPELEEEIVRLRREGLSIPQIAAKVELSVGSVYRVLKKHGLTGRVD